MSDPIDIKLEQGDNGLFDISINADGDLTHEMGFDTAINLSLLMEQRADESEVTIPEFRRGWIGNIFNEDSTDEWGSKIWLYYQARNRNEELEACIGFSEQSLAWLVEDRHATGIDFNNSTLDGTRITLNGIINVSPDEVQTVNFNLWEFTGN